MSMASRMPLARRSEEHTSELQSHVNLVCRLLLEKKKNLTLSQLFRHAHIHHVHRNPIGTHRVIGRYHGVLTCSAQAPNLRERSLFFFNDTATTEICTLSLHDALPICRERPQPPVAFGQAGRLAAQLCVRVDRVRSEEHTSELQSHVNLVCRLLLE